MLNKRLKHAVTEAHRVASGFERSGIQQRPSRMSSRRLVRTLAVTTAVVALIGVGWFASVTFRTDNTPVYAESGTQINDDPPVAQALGATPPNFELPPAAVEVPLVPITEYRQSDASYIRSFIAEADQIIAIGQIDDGAHRVFLVSGFASKNLAGDGLVPAGSQATCIVDTAGNSGSCGIGDKGDVAPVFGFAEGWGTDDGSEFTVVRGIVPASTSVVTVTTPQGVFWQVPSGGVAFLVLKISPDKRSDIAWQFHDAAGSLLGYRSTSRAGLTAEEAQVTPYWVNMLGLNQVDSAVWRDRFDRMCDEGVWNTDVALRLAAEFIDFDLKAGVSIRVGDIGPPLPENGADALWIMAFNTCRDRFPAEAIERGRPSFGDG